MVGGMDDHKDMFLAEQWAKKGHVVVRGIYSAERTQRLEEICERILAQWRERNPETGEPGGSRRQLLDAPPEPHRLLLQR